MHTSFDSIHINIPANLRRSKIWRLSILHYIPPPPPNVKCTNNPTPPANKLPYYIIYPRNCTINTKSSNFVKKWTKFQTKAQKCSKVHFIREIWCSNRKTGRFDEKLGDSRKNRESWQVCINSHSWFTTT